MLSFRQFSRAIFILAFISLIFWGSQKILNPTGQASWVSVMPPMIGIVFAFLFRNVYFALGAAVLSGAFLSASGFTEFFIQTYNFVANPIKDSLNLKILSFIVCMIWGLLLMLRNGGLQILLAKSARWAEGRRATQVSTIILGLLVFVDDYANTWLVGSTMQGPADKTKVSREKLSFLVDATSAPIAGVALVSTWIGYELGLFQEFLTKLSIDKDPYSLFLEALPFRFYCFLMLGFVVLNALSLRDFGPMKKAEQRALKKNLVQNKSSQDKESTFYNWRVLSTLLPLLSLFGLLIYGFYESGGGSELRASGVVGWDFLRKLLVDVDSIHVLFWVSAVFFSLNLIFYVPFHLRSPKKEWQSLSAIAVKGALVPLGILILAWALKQSCDALETHVFLAETYASAIPLHLFPVIVFVLAGITAFSTGTSWGTMAILIPTLLPLAYQLEGGQLGLVGIMSAAAILDGAIFGDHCSPISDTSIMSASASGCDLMAHVKTQLPYALLVASVVGLFCYIPVAYGLPVWLSYVGAMTLISSSFWYLSRDRR
jgi:Na+/H+ antiporter NhaC